MPGSRGVTSILEFISRFESGFTSGQLITRFLRANDASVIFAGPVSGLLRPPNGSWHLHVRLPRPLEERFGISRQFLVLCLPVTDLRSQHVLLVKSLISQAEVRVEPDFAMVVTSDPETATKIADWGVDRDTGVVIAGVSTDALEEFCAGSAVQGALATIIGDWLRSQNLYDQRDPATGDRFFGRADLLRELDRKVGQNRGHVGVFGLRRIGKTSVLYELQDRLRRRKGVSPFFVDLERYGSAAQAAFQLGGLIIKRAAEEGSASERAMRQALRVPDHWHDIDPTSLIAAVGDALISVMTSGALRDKQVVLIMDEAESLLPDPLKPGKHAVTFFRMLRGVAQETRSLSLVLAGVNATPSESAVLGDDDNPLFQLVAPEYLGPLEDVDCSEMVRKVGRRMQIKWDQPILDELTAAAGGHPLLARLIASDVVTSNVDRPLRPTHAQLRDVLASFEENHSSVFEQIVFGLKRYYPDELDLLLMIAAGEIDFASDLIDDNPRLLKHLVGYGVVEPRDLSISIPVFGRWLRAHRR